MTTGIQPDMTDAEIAETAPEEQDKDHIYVKLSKPIRAYTEEVSVLKMRLPTTGDIVRVGNPVIFDPISDPPQISHNQQRMLNMVARLANVPSGSLEKMPPQDWVAVCWAVTPFLIPNPGQA
jgi:Phage tail assembly chaperone proteins, E, or 41 or 14